MILGLLNFKLYKVYKPALIRCNNKGHQFIVVKVRYLCKFKINNNF